MVSTEAAKSVRWLFGIRRGSITYATLAQSFETTK